MSTNADEQKILIKVPASSANLCVGFDCMGVALDLVAAFEITASEKLVFDGCEERFCNENNLVWQSYLQASDMLGCATHPLHISIHSPIPLSGGLGSSSCCVIAGVAAALIYSPYGWDKHKALSIACAIEGHPDNVAPALLGSLVSSFTDKGLVHPVVYKISERIRFVIIAPTYEVRTEEARKILPREVSLDTAVWQMGRCVAMVKAFETADGDLLCAAAHDKLHEPYRSTLIPDYTELKKLALGAGANAFMISGSGSSTIAVCTDLQAEEKVQSTLQQHFPDFWIRSVSANTKGSSVEIVSL